jgi:AraC-like DNA-binding protein
MKITTFVLDTNEIVFDEEYLSMRRTQGLIQRSINIKNRHLTCSFDEAGVKDIFVQSGELQVHNDVKVVTNYLGPTLTIYFGLKGSLEWIDSETLETCSVNENEFCVAYNDSIGKKVIIEKDQQAKYLYINLVPKYFLHNISNQFLTTESFLMHLRLDFRFTNKINGSITSLMHETIEQLINSQSVHLVKAIFVKAKVLELFVLLLEEIDRVKKSSEKYFINATDIEKLYHAREILKSRMSDPPTIKELARLASTNEFKLKRGFRVIFNHSVYGLLFEYRMKAAKQLLLETTRPISDIAEQLGYNYAHHFSKAFKRKYNLLPTEVRSRKNSR